MSTLRQREEVKFDVTNPEHRRIAHYFFSNHRWPAEGHKFWLDPQFLSIPHMIQSYVTNYFLSKEFNNEA